MTTFIQQDPGWKITLALVSRRKWLSAKAPCCPTCLTCQVQLTNAHACPAEWRCRMCKAEFKFEPESK